MRAGLCGVDQSKATGEARNEPRRGDCKIKIAIKVTGSTL
jgi:hypothetical protein